MQKATLLLEDGTRLEGSAAGVNGATVGDLSVYTAFDYMKRLTDPCSSGKICAFTMPSTGLWGVNTEHCESGKPWVRGMITRRIENDPSNWRSAETLDYYLRRHLIIAIRDIDTVALAAYVRKKRIGKCAIVSSPGFSGWDALLAQVKSYRYDNTFPGAVKSPEVYGPDNRVAARVAVMDFGASRLLTRLLAGMRVNVTLLPPYDATTIVARGGYDALLLPPGPGTPRNHPGITNALQVTLQSGLPVLGMGLGAGFIAAAEGGKVTKMDQPHQGEWIPIVDVSSGLVTYTRQYHEYTLAQPLPDSVIVTHRNCLDDSVEGFRLADRPVLGVQYSPCTDPRLGGTGDLLREFSRLFKGGAHEKALG